MMPAVTDGWHTVCGRMVWVENGVVMRGTKKNSDGSEKTTHPYVWNGGARQWVKASGELNTDQLYARMKRGTAEMI